MAGDISRLCDKYENFLKSVIVVVDTVDNCEAVAQALWG